MDERIEKIESLLKERSNAMSLVKTFLSHISTPVVMLDANLNLLLWSRKFAQEFFKENLSEFQGKPLRDVAPSVFAALEDKHLLRLSLDGQTFDGYIGINGHRRFFTHTIAPWIQDGLVCGIIVSFTNVTSEKILYDRLNIYESRLNLLSSLSREAVWIIDENENTVAINDALCQILELPKEEIIGRKIYEFAANENWVHEAEQKIKNRKSGMSEIHDFIFKSNSKNKLCEVRTSPLLSDNNIYIGAIAMINEKEENNG